MSDNYRADAINDAADTAENFIAEIVEQLIDDGKASDDLLNDYPDGDSYHHESHVDKDYRLLEAATLLDQLYEFEETDSGLWEGQSPRDAIGTQAAFTYGAAVYSMFTRLVAEINDDDEITDLIGEHNAIDDREEPTDKDDADREAIREKIQARAETIIRDFRS
jgi:trans-aconitate methyltransferase